MFRNSWSDWYGEARFPGYGHSSDCNVAMGLLKKRVKPFSFSHSVTSTSYCLLNVLTSLASTNKVTFTGSVMTEYWYRFCSVNEGGPSLTTQSVERRNNCLIFVKS